MTLLYQLFCDRVMSNPNHPAILGPDPNVQISYRQLASLIDRYADVLHRIGIVEGSTVGLHYESGMQYIITAYALWKCGACIAPIPIELKPNEKNEVLQRIGLSHIISSDDSKIDVDQYSKGESIPLPGNGSVVSIDSPANHPSEFESLNAAFIRFTSGTTGTSKGIVLSHETIYDRILAANEVLEINESDRVVWLLSMSYHFTVSVVGYLTLGATIVLPEHLYAKGLLNAIKDHRATGIYGSPLHYSQMTRNRKEVNVPSLRFAISTTTGLNRDIAVAFQNRFHLPLTQAYGIIEVGLPCINRDFASNHPEAVGRVLPAFDIRLLPHDEDSPYDEILFRGKGILDAYYDPWRTRSEIMVDGWFHTGDLGEIDENGCVLIRGRIKEMISVAGMKVFPKEVETVLKQHPDVVEAVVYGMPHPQFGQEVHANVKLSSAAQPSIAISSIRDLCGNLLADFKVPKQINFVDEIVYTASGKPIRRPLQLAENLV